MMPVSVMRENSNKTLWIENNTVTFYYDAKTCEKFIVTNII